MKLNAGTTDRIVRVVAGLVLLGVGLFVVKGGFGIALDVVGAVLVFSGTVGFCHVYKVFGINTTRKS